ncbi:hypothetical protein E5163_09480 [Marinicauda algicola]|uniref:Uncharacterized protein n=1 Tax=Marinicauda algicola TaxID=2029849 RepID=A0A4S2H1D1_9PROT|nr:hypothetical protein [Marinicauda algicola]TGY89335.1 hypothetical protein E5163_09480 [Marinicauda algicola]
MIAAIVSRLDDWSRARERAALARAKQTLDQAVQAAIEADDPVRLRTIQTGYRRIAERACSAGHADIQLAARGSEAAMFYELGSAHLDRQALFECIERVRSVLASGILTLSAADIASLLRIMAHSYAEIADLDGDAAAFRHAIRAYEASLDRLDTPGQDTIEQLTRRNIRRCEIAVAAGEQAEGGCDRKTA